MIHIMKLVDTSFKLQDLISYQYFIYCTPFRLTEISKLRILGFNLAQDTRNVPISIYREPLVVRRWWTPHLNHKIRFPISVLYLLYLSD